MKIKKIIFKITFSLLISLLVSPFYISAIQRDFHGTLVEDPYFWLEDMKSLETQNWVDNQVKQTSNYFENLAYRDNIKKAITAKSNLESFSIPLKKGNSLFFFMRDKDQEKFSLYMQDDLGNRKTLIDMSDSKNDSLTGVNISPDGKILAYGISDSGSDSQTWKFLNLETTDKTQNEHLQNEHFQDELTNIKFSHPIWKKDNKGVYYFRLFKDEKDSKEHQDIYYHELNDSQENDKLIFDTTNYPNGLLDSYYITLDNKFLMTTLRTSGSLNNTIFLIDLTTNHLTKIPYAKNARFNFIGENKKKLFFITDLDASNYRLIAIDLTSNDFNNFQEIVKEEKYVLSDASLLKDRIVLEYLENCCSKLKVCDLSGKYLNDISLPNKGMVQLPFSSFDSSSDEIDNNLFFAYTDFTTPKSIFKYDISNNTSNVFFQPSIKNSSTYLTKQVFFPSKDKTLIPMFITYKKGLDLTKTNPALMYGYGGFNISIPPFYSPLAAAFLDLGGIYVSANLRGGAEYGNAWHEEGTLDKKQNVFDDFIAAGEYLIKNGYTSSEKLAISGASNGGLLVGACLIQRSDLFTAAIAKVGVFDMLQFHKFTIGWAWKCDYGDPEDPYDFSYLYKYSPYHNVKDNQNYPSTLLITADSDDRVVPMHSYKFAARLQEVQNNSNPILLRVNRNSGHSSGQSLIKSIEENTDILTFLINELKIDIEK
ncbi:MAG: Prolyl endopeptidase [Candidatus Anoxychlamydiales bacterium]|nr:Prolyl endopeptidase [Candidatus Anoxychlamydiales bacterium]